MSSAATSRAESGNLTPPPRSRSRTKTTLRLGDDLLAQGLITEAQLDWALEAHERTGERLGRILLAAGLVDRRALQRTLARAWSLPFFDLRKSPAEIAVAERFPREVLVREGWIPLAVHGTTLIVAT